MATFTTEFPFLFHLLTSCKWETNGSKTGIGASILCCFLTRSERGKTSKALNFGIARIRAVDNTFTTLSLTSELLTLLCYSIGLGCVLTAVFL